VANRWTEEQRAAILSKNQNLLLSAAAGSGKTAVLVERIITRLTDESAPVDADKLLVVTFTNAAAAEMRERIIVSLTALIEKHPENAFLANQLLLIKKAQITTIDAFCIDLLRRNFVAANLSPDFKIADPTENAVLCDEVLDEVLTDMYDDAEFAEDFFSVLESYANAKANDKMFRELVHSLFSFAMSLPNPKEWLISSAEAFSKAYDFEQTAWCKAVIAETKTELMRAVSEYDTLVYLAEQDGLTAYHTLLLEERDMLKKASALDEYDALKSATDAILFKSRPRAPKDFAPRYFEVINEMRDKIKKKRISKVREKLLPITAMQQSSAILNTYSVMRCLAEIVIRLKDSFLQRKLEKNILDFNDCEHLCLQLLINDDGTPSETALETQQKYEEIYIDEYQDTSKLQEAIFSLIKRENNVFMVGDIKQSIYRFRNTDPTLFQEKRDCFSPQADAENRKIVLSKNFRSRENVLSSVNFIFERIMSRQTGEIDYNEEEKLYPGATFPDDAPNPISQETELCLVELASIKETKDDAEDAEKLELEAFAVANRIAELIKNQEEIFADGAYRPIRYSDICIISRSTKTSAPLLVSVLSERGIPCFSENTGGFLNSTEITTVLAALSVIDNPFQDLPLLTLLRSVMFHFTAEILARIRCCDKKGSFYDALIACADANTPASESAREALCFIQEFINKSTYMSVSELIMELYNSTGFYDAQQTQPNGAIRRANLRLLYNRAREFEKTGLKGLYSFIRFMNEYNATGGDFDAAKTVGAEQDAVRIMSIHKSKGLEFPVVILFGIEHKFNMMDLTKSVLFHAKLGFGPKYIDTEHRITYPFAPRVALESTLRAESLAEEMRILYVAMTRAKEKLILVGAVQSVEKFVNTRAFGESGRKLSVGSVLSADSYIDWIVTALMGHPDGDVFRKKCFAETKCIHDKSRFKISIIDDAASLLLPETANVQTEEQVEPENLDKLLSLVLYQYPYVDDTTLPSKITVTELKRKMQAEDDGGVYLFQPNKEAKTFSKQLTGAQIGTAYHTVMQHLDLKAPLFTREDIQMQICAIKERGYLTDEEAGAIHAEKIVRFFSSHAGKVMLSATNVHREMTFAILEPANRLFEDFKSDKPIMLQGTIDCVAETEQGIYIIDYKTDKTFHPQETVEKYKIQLACYKMAAERIFKKPVISKILYLFDADMGINL